MAAQATVPVVPLMPSEITDISVDMRSPTQPGMYESKWRMATPHGAYFGGKFKYWFFSWIFFLQSFDFYLLDTIWVILSVDEGGTLALTQQLTHFNALGSVIPMSPPLNPFAAQQLMSRNEQVNVVNNIESTH